MCSRFTLHPSLSLQRVSQGLPFTYTGADMYALCSDAMLKAITRQARAVDEKVKTYNSTRTPAISIAHYFDHFATEEDTAVMVTEPDFFEAHKELVPSVSADELRHYEKVRNAFEGAGKKDDEKKKDAVSGSRKGKGKAIQDGDLIASTEEMSLNGANQKTGNSSSGGKGKGKATVDRRGSTNSLDIAEGGFGEAGQDDDLYT